MNAGKSHQNRWFHTANALDELQNLLICNLCQKMMKHPVTFGNCDHYFCRNCAKNYGSNSCPECNVPSRVCDLKESREMHNIVKLSQQIKELITDNTDNCDEDAIACTPDNVSDSVSRPVDNDVSRRTRGAVQTAIRDKRHAVRSKRLETANDEWGIGRGQDSIEHCLSCRRKDNSTSDAKRVTLLSPSFSQINSLTSPSCECSNEESTGHSLVEAESDSIDAAPHQSCMEITSDSLKDKETFDNKTRKSKKSRKIRDLKAKDPNKKVTSLKNLNKKNPKGETALHTAVVKGDNEKVKMLLAQGADPNTHDHAGLTPLHEAACAGNVDTLKQLIEHGALVKGAMKADSPLHDAVQNNHIECVQILVAHGADINFRDEKGYTPQQYSETAEMNDALNMSTGISTPTQDQNDTTQKTSTVSDNLQPYVNLDRLSTSDISRSDPSSESKTKTKRSPSVIVREETTTEYLPTPKIDKKSSRKSKHLKTSTNLSPFHQNRDTGKLLSPVRSPASSNLNKKNAKGETPLHVATIKGDIDRVWKLLEEGANPNTKDNAGWTPLHEAACLGKTSIVTALLENGAFVNAPALNNDSPLHDAVQNRHLDCVKVLLAHGADVNVRNANGLCPKDFAHDDAMKAVLETLNTNTESVQQKNKCYTEVDTSNQKLVLLGTSIKRDKLAMLQRLAVIGQGQIVNEFSSKVTHIVTEVNKYGMCPRTIKYLLGVLTGKWIVTVEWVEQSLKLDQPVCEEAFEVIGSNSHPNSEAATRGRINALNQLPGLFDGCQMFFHGTFKYPTPSKNDLIKLVNLGGGKVLTREPKLDNIDEGNITVPYHAESKCQAVANCSYFIIHDDTSTKIKPIRHTRLVTVPVTWLINCIGQFKILEIPDL